MIRDRLDRIQEEIVNCQFQIAADKVVEKSYFTSISSSISPSPLLSPTRTVRMAGIYESLSPADKERIN
jgi:hypothetical protein